MKEHMGEEQVSVKEGVPVVQLHYLSFLLSRLRPEGSERPRVVSWPNCSSMEEATFIRVLKRVFLITLTLSAFSLVDPSPTSPYRTPLWLFMYFRISWMGIVLLAVLAAAVVVNVFKKMMLTKSAGSAPAKREQLQTVSALVQQV